MKKLILIIIAALLIGLAGCQKDETPKVEKVGDAVTYLEEHS